MTFQKKGMAAGRMQRWDLLNNYIYFSPTPSASWKLRLRAAFSDALPQDSNTTNQWLTFAPDWLMAETGLQVAAKHVKDPDMIAGYLSDVQTTKSRVFIAHERRMHSGRRYSMDTV